MKVQDVAPSTPQATDKVGISRTAGTTALTATLQSIADLGAVGNVGEIQIKDTTGLTSTPNVAYNSTDNHLALGEPTLAIPDIALAISSDVDSYAQLSFQNKSNGTSASTDLVLTADDGDDTDYWIDVGISSSNYDDPINYPLTKAHDGYLWTSGGDLYIGAITPGKAVKIHAGGVDINNLIAEFSGTGLDLIDGTTLSVGGYPVPLNPGIWIEGSISNGSTSNKVIVAANRGTFLSNISNKLETYTLAEIELDIYDDKTTYILANFNSQSFIVSDTNTANYTTILPYAEIFKRSGSTARHTQISTILSNGESTEVYKKDHDAEKYTSAGGFDGLGVDGSLGITLNGGEMFSVHTKYTIPDVTSATRNFYPVKGTDGWYYTGRSGTTPTVNTTYWNDTTQLGVNAAVALTTGYWTINWMYRGCENEDHLYMIAGTAEYATSALALAVPQPDDADLPDMVTSHAFFVGRVVIQEGDTTGATAIVDGEYDNLFDKLSAITHGGGGGGGTITDATYAELYALSLASGFTSEALYRITDFQTAHKISYTDHLVVGVQEDLIVRAKTTSQLYLDAYSELYPQDKLQYVMRRLNINGTEEVPTLDEWRGWITYREDTTRNIIAYHDWRNCKTICWESDTDPLIYQVQPWANTANTVHYLTMVEDADASPGANVFDIYVGSQVGNTEYAQVIFRSGTQKVRIGQSTDPCIFNGEVNTIEVGDCSRVEAWGSASQVSIHGSCGIQFQAGAGSVDIGVNNFVAFEGGLYGVDVYIGSQSDTTITGDQTNVMIGWPTVTIAAPIADNTVATGHADGTVTWEVGGGASTWDDLTGTATDITFDITPAVVPTAVGSMYWDEAHHTVSIQTSTDTTLQIGQENVVLCLNSTGSPIANGAIVRISGAGAGALKDRPTIALAQANAESTSYPLGVATQAIANGAEGFITTLGTVNEIDCRSYTAGQILYLSAATPGAFTTTRPAAPDHAVYVARALNDKNSNAGGAIFVSPHLGSELDELHDVLISAPAAGELLVRNSGNTLWENKTIAEAGIAAATHADTHIADTGSDPLHAFDVNAMSYHGWYNRDMTVGATPVTYGPLPQQLTTTTFTLYGARSTCVYYYQATKVTVTTNKTCTLDDGSAGLYFVYFNADTGNILATKNFPGVFYTSNVMIATVTWNGTNVGWVNDERHGYLRNGIWHLYQHTHVGTLYGSGIVFTPTGSGAGLTFATSSGDIDDEDISFTVNASSTFPTPNTCRLARQTGASTYVFNDAVSTKPFYWNGGTTRVQYVDAATAYALTDANSGRYVNVWLYATTDLHTPIVAIPETLPTATGGYTTIANARAITPPSLSGMAISAEMKILYRLIVTGAGTISETTDYRASSPLPAGGSASTSAAAVSFTPGGTIAASTVQGAIEELDTEKLADAAGSIAADGKSYARKDGAWSEVTATGGLSATFPFYKDTGALDAIALVSSSYLPFFDNTGATKNILLTIV